MHLRPGTHSLHRLLTVTLQQLLVRTPQLTTGSTPESTHRPSFHQKEGRIDEVCSRYFF